MKNQQKGAYKKEEGKESRREREEREGGRGEGGKVMLAGFSWPWPDSPDQTELLVIEKTTKCCNYR